jgi:2-haloacid dehalogenase
LRGIDAPEHIAAMPAPSPHGVRAILFDTFGTVVDWRTSLITELSAWAETRGIGADWAGLVDAWRGAYAPAMDRVRRGELPWTILDDLHRATLERLVVQFGIAGLDAADLDWINRGWHRLRPWPDSVPGLTRLKSRYIIAPLSNGNVALLVDMAKAAGIPWDMICSTELFRHYKPDPETYLGAAALLGLAPGEVMMAAAHNGDLAAARACGLKTAFFARPTEYGPLQVRDFAADAAWDVIAADIGDLATRMGC